MSQDAKTAARWFERASRQGYTLAQSNLAAMYAGGQGVEKDMAKAYYWLLIARQQDPALQSRVETAEQELSAAERVRIQRLVSAWKPVRE